MRIGLDIDNVITDLDDKLLKEFLIEDKKKRNSGIINPHASHIINGMFDWSKKEVDDFFAQNMQQLARELKPRRNCRKVIEKLLADGHEIYLITHRVYPHYTEPYEVTVEWFEKHKIPYTQLIISSESDKTYECKKNKIEIMVDDRIDKCTVMTKNGINCIVMKTRYHKNEKHNLLVAKSWDNLYEEIKNWKKKV